MKSLLNDIKESPQEPKRTRIKVEGIDAEKEEKYFEQQTCDMKFTQEWNSWQKVNGKFEEDWAKTYALIFCTYCTSEMRTTIKEDPNFERVIRDNPLEVLRVISFCALPSVFHVLGDVTTQLSFCGAGVWEGGGLTPILPICDFFYSTNMLLLLGFLLYTHKEYLKFLLTKSYHHSFLAALASQLVFPVD